MVQVPPELQSDIPTDIILECDRCGFDEAENEKESEIINHGSPANPDWKWVCGNPQCPHSGLVPLDLFRIDAFMDYLPDDVEQAYEQHKRDNPGKYSKY